MQSIDLRNADSLDWRLFQETPSFRRYLAFLPDGRQVMKTEYLADNELIEQNKALRNESDGTRWGDGQVVGRVPLNVLFSSQHQIAEKLREGDRDHIKWWLNSEHAAPYRTRRGKI